MVTYHSGFSDVLGIAVFCAQGITEHNHVVCALGTELPCYVCFCSVRHSPN